MKIIQKDNKRRSDYLNTKSNHRDQLLLDIREAIKEDCDKKREISNLKKKDQEENF